MKNSGMLTKLYFKLLPVQCLIVAMGAVNSIVDGVIAARCIDATAVGVVGLYYSMVSVLQAVGAVLLGGTAVLCGKAMGCGDMKKTSTVFTVNLTTALAAGIMFTALSFIVPGPIAGILGASEELKPALVDYVRGYGVGIMPLLLSQQIASFLQMERQSKRGYAGIAGMIITNTVLDLVFVAAMDLGVFGLALATSLGNWVYFLILVPYYQTGKSQLRMKLKSFDLKVLGQMTVIGIPGAVLIFVLAIRGITLNRILLKYVGTAGLSAQSALNMLNGLFVAFALGIGATLRMLASIFFGEEDRDSLKRLMRISLTRSFPMSFIVTALVAALSAFIASVFFPDKSSEVFILTRQLFLIYSFCIPLIVLVQIISNYLQAGGHNVFVNVLSVFDGFFSMIVPALILAPRMGALGVWISNPIGIMLTLLLSLGYACVFNRGFPKTAEEWMMLRDDFGVPDMDRLDIAIRSMDDVMRTAEQVQTFCEAHGIKVDATKKSPYSVDENVWGRAIECGVLEDPWNRPPADMWEMTVDPADAPDEPCEVVVSFEGGQPVALDGEKMSMLKLIQKMNKIAGSNGFGRLDTIEDRLVGVKSRECYEQPAALALITAHKALEDLCLPGNLLAAKLELEHTWATTVYNGLWYSPLKQACDAFFAYTQKTVTGDVRLKFYKGTCTVNGSKSPNSIYDFGLATYDEGDTFDRQAAKGFMDLFGLQNLVWAKRNGGLG